MAKKDAAFKPLTEGRAFDDLVVKLKRAYGQLPADAVEARKQHIDALFAIASFAERMEPDGLPARVADQLASLAQALYDVNRGIRATIFTPSLKATNRGDTTMVWLGRALVARAIETLRHDGYSRERGAEWVTARYYRELEWLITELVSSPEELQRRALSWSEDFNSDKIKNAAAARNYSDGVRKLRAWALAPTRRTKGEIEKEVDRLLKDLMQRVRGARVNNFRE
jgi:hypothetical protein